MPLCKESNIEVIAWSVDDKPCIKVVCGECHKTIVTTEEGWYVIDYGVIKQAVNEHLIEVRAAYLDTKWEAFRKGLIRK
jgi:hypothetical protein